MDLKSLARRAVFKDATLSELLKKHLTYFRLHLAYFILITFIGTMALWGICAGRASFIDCLYNITSASCVTGLSGVAVESIPTGGQVVLMLMMVFGSQVSTSVVPLFVKRRRYCKVARLAMRLKLEKTFSTSTFIPSRSSSSGRSRSFSIGDRVRGLKRLRTSVLLIQRDDELWMEEMATRQKAQHLKEVFQEYQATVALIKVVVGYYLLVQLVGFFISFVSIMSSPHARRLLNRKKVNKGFFALFLTISAFANGGFVLVDENMVAFNESVVLLLNTVVLILLGNTLYAPALRGIIWLLHRYASGSRKEAYEYLLDHPRKCFTHLFPQVTTYWLVLVVTGFNGFEILMFYILDWKSTALKGAGTGSKLLNGVFQSMNTRSAGMNSINIAELSAPMLFLYCGMMYIAAYPVYLSRQYSHHRAPLGGVQDLDTTISTQSKRLLASDWAYLFLSIFFIAVVENKHFKRDPLNYNIFNIVFEVISAYGNVGLTLGYSCALRITPGFCQDVASSFSGRWNTIAKLLLIIVMFLGRHRGLPDNIDSAIILPEMKFSSYLMRRRPTPPKLPSREDVEDGKGSTSEDGTTRPTTIRWSLPPQVGGATEAGEAPSEDHQASLEDHQAPLYEYEPLSPFSGHGLEMPETPSAQDPVSWAGLVYPPSPPARILLPVQLLELPEQSGESSDQNPAEVQAAEKNLEAEPAGYTSKLRLQNPEAGTQAEGNAAD